MKYLLFLFCALVFVSCSEDPGDTISYSINDNSPINIVSPAEMQVVTGSFYLNVLFDDLLGVSRVIVSINSNKTEYYPGSQLLLEIPTYALRYGVNEIKIRLYDKFGNEVNKTRKVYLDRP